MIDSVTKLLFEVVTTPSIVVEIMVVVAFPCEDSVELKVPNSSGKVVVSDEVGEGLDSVALIATECSVVVVLVEQVKGNGQIRRSRSRKH